MRKRRRESNDKETERGSEKKVVKRDKRERERVKVTKRDIEMSGSVKLSK